MVNCKKYKFEKFLIATKTKLSLFARTHKTDKQISLIGSWNKLDKNKKKKKNGIRYRKINIDIDISDKPVSFQNKRVKVTNKLIKNINYCIFRIKKYSQVAY